MTDRAMITVRLEHELHDRLKQEATVRVCTLNDLCLLALEAELRRPQMAPVRPPPPAEAACQDPAVVDEPAGED